MRCVTRLAIGLIAAALVLAGPAAASAAGLAPNAHSAYSQPKPPTQSVQIGPYVFTVPAGWLTWTYDEDLTESRNEQALIAVVEQIDPALVEGATEIVEANVPDMIAAAFAPEAPGGELVYISLMSFGYQASLEGLKLTAQATPEQVITALGFPEVEQAHTLTAGFFLEEDQDETTFTGGFALPDLDRIIVLSGGGNSLGWQTYGDEVQTAIRSFVLDEEGDTGDQTGNPPAPATDLQTGQIPTGQLQVLTPANPLYLYPYEFPVPMMVTGAVDLTRQPIEPILEKVEGTQTYLPVVGYVTAEPTFAFIAQPNPNGTVGVVFAGNNYVDTVLLVHCPNGQWNFADDVKWANPDPAIAANLAQEGVYEVWIGSKLPNQTVSGTLYVLVQ